MISPQLQEDWEANGSAVRYDHWSFEAITLSNTTKPIDRRK